MDKKKMAEVRRRMKGDPAEEAYARDFRSKAQAAKNEADTIYPLRFEKDGSVSRLPPGDYSGDDSVSYARAGMSRPDLDEKAERAAQKEADFSRARKLNKMLTKRFPVGSAGKK